MDTENNNSVGRPQANLDECFTKIQPYLQLGYSFHKACLYAEIPYTTYKKYYDENQDFRNKIDKERSQVNLTARKNIVDRIKTGDTKLSLRWLESFENDDFGLKIKNSKSGLPSVTYVPPSWFEPPTG